MRVSENFVLREIAGESILVPYGAAAARFNGMITMNGTGSFLWNLLREERTLDELALGLAEEYGVSVEEARADAGEFVEQLRAVGALVEEQ